MHFTSSHTQCMDNLLFEWCEKQIYYQYNVYCAHTHVCTNIHVNKHSRSRFKCLLIQWHFFFVVIISFLGFIYNVRCVMRQYPPHYVSMCEWMCVFFLLFLLPQFIHILADDHVIWTLFSVYYYLACCVNCLKSFEINTSNVVVCIELHLYDYAHPLVDKSLRWIPQHNFHLFKW